MSGKDVMQLVEERNMNKDHAHFEVGDTVDVHVKISEGDKTRIQKFTGTVIARKHRGLNETFTVRRIVDGTNEGVERTFPLHSPLVDKIQVKRHGVIKRAKLYYLRDRVGKATRLTERKTKRKQEVAAASVNAPVKKKGRRRGSRGSKARAAKA
ncbi:MAG: 50S ribosomal protein L19 [Planctomycetes bacterium]|nr:50S ribosomal protein L19 [Planctomycetota bacterium]